MPPPIMLLSDGGHVENLALLPLLKKRLKRIIVVDGGYKHDQKLYGESLLNALMLARTKLKCSFLSVGASYCVVIRFFHNIAVTRHRITKRIVQIVKAPRYLIVIA